MQNHNTKSKPIPVIEGKHIRLREVNYDDTDTIISWRNDDKLGRVLKDEKLTKERHYQFLQHYFKKDNDFYFVGETKVSKIPIGTVAIFDVSFISRRAEFGRIVVSENYRLFVFEISYLALEFAFETLKLHKVYGQI